jgi:hypothetical protein
MQHFQVKVFAAAGSAPDLGEAIPVFHRWIQQRVFDELLIDVADYRHVVQGPGVILVSHDAIRSLDQEPPGLGLMYSRRTALEGTVADRLRQALDAALAACDRLEAEPEFAGNLRFDRGHIEVRVNDRLLAPNNDATWAALEPELRNVFDARLGAGMYRLERSLDERALAGAAVSA